MNRKLVDTLPNSQRSDWLSRFWLAWLASWSIIASYLLWGMLAVGQTAGPLAGPIPNEGPGAATVAEIYQAMVDGGFHFQTENPNYRKRGVYSVLADARTFHRLPDGRYGLALWYPAAKTRVEPNGRRRQERRKRKTVKRGPKNQPSQTRSESTTKPSVRDNHQVGDSEGGPSIAVIKYVHLHPRCKPGEVVSAVAPHLTTRSADPTTMLSSLIRKLISKGKLRRVGQDGKELEAVEGA